MFENFNWKFSIDLIFSRRSSYAENKVFSRWIRYVPSVKPTLFIEGRFQYLIFLESLIILILNYFII